VIDTLIAAIRNGELDEQLAQAAFMLSIYAEIRVGEIAALKVSDLINQWLTAMPGAAPVVWCDLRGLPKEQQRGMVQPFIAAMQVASMVLLIGSGNLSTKVLGDLAVTLPAVAVGTALGIYMFGKAKRANVSARRTRGPFDFRYFVSLALKKPQRHSA